MKYLIFVLVACSALGAERPMPATVAPGAELRAIYSDPRFFEGPTWDPKSGKLFFTAFGKSSNDTEIVRWEGPGRVSVWATNTQGVCGTFLSKDGRMLGAQAYGHRLLSYKLGEVADGTKVLAANTHWNQPNDVCQTVKGDIYFTDPDRSKGHQRSAVLRLDAEGNVTTVATNLEVPNGIIASPDGKVLYVSDSSRKLWMSYPIRSDGTLGAGEVFFNPDTPNKNNPDGMTVDEKGNLYLCGRGGVWVVSARGKALGLIEVPEFVSNATFGGKDGKTLFLTCKGKVYSLEMKVRGVGAF